MREKRIALLGLGSELTQVVKQRFANAAQHRTVPTDEDTIAVFGYETVSIEEREALARSNAMAVVLTDTLEASYEPISQFSLVAVGTPYDANEIATGVETLSGGLPSFDQFFAVERDTESLLWKDSAAFVASIVKAFEPLGWPSRMQDVVLQGAEELCNVAMRCTYQKPESDEITILSDAQRFGFCIRSEGAEKSLENVLTALRIAVRDLRNQRAPMQGLSLAVFSAWSTASSLVVIRKASGDLHLGLIWRKAPSYRDFSKRAKSIFFAG